MKSVSAVAAAAFIAAIVTLLSAPTAMVDAHPSLKPVSAAPGAPACAELPWPYLNCVGTALGNPNVRLIATDRR